MSENSLHVFDFDGTLIRGNSLNVLFRVLARSRWHLGLSCARPKALAAIGAQRSVRRGLKAYCYSHFAGGRAESDIHAAAAKVAEQLEPIPEVWGRLVEAVDNGLPTLVATASPRISVAAILAAMGLPQVPVIGTELLHENDVLTGKFSGGECEGPEKLRRFLEYRSGIAHIDYLIAYGNLPHDRPLLEAADEAFVVERSGRVRPYRGTSSRTAATATEA